MSDKNKPRDVDAFTGIETTQHVWDEDIRELNKPLPKWWLFTFYATIIWAVGYVIAYPAIPLVNDYTHGLLGYSQRAQVASDVAAAKASQSKYLTAIGSLPLADIAKDEQLAAFVRAGGAAQFATNCSPCHGRGAQGRVGYPNLGDDDWLWGGTLDAIHQTIVGGIRSGHPNERNNVMPRFGVDQVITPPQINDVAEFVMSLSNRADDKAAAERGKPIFAEQCVGCHKEDGKGNIELGSPNLTDEIWLYGGDKEAIVESIRSGRANSGRMPSWEARLDPATIKMLTVYVHSLGGGQ